MLPEFTPAVGRALALAAGCANAEGSVDVAPRHIAHGLLVEEEGRAFVAALAAGLDPVAYRQQRPDLAGASTEASLPLHAVARAALNLARSLARDYASDDAIAGDVLLAALLRTDEPLRQTFEQWGLRIQDLESALFLPTGPPLDLDEPLDLSHPAPIDGAARLIDAAANRAREGLRVVEDYCRFVLDDSILCGELKALRHDLTAALVEMPANVLLQSRDTLGDIGTTLRTNAEGERDSPRDVAQVNLKRLQEALRSLEEFGKLHGAELGRALEALRYRAYTLEKAIVVGSAARERLAQARLCLLASGAHCLGSLETTILEAAAGGVDVVQLREKSLNDRDLLERARQVRRWTRQANVLFVLNDRADLARLADADGVHLGQHDLPVREARRILGPDALIGVSTHNLEQLRQAVLDGASYVGVGPTFPSATKDFDQLAGLDFVQAAFAATTLPAFAIGGIDTANITSVVAVGARRAAVSQAILRAESPRAAATELRRRLA